MNLQIYTFGLFVLWFAVSLSALVIVPIFKPKLFIDSSRLMFLGIGAGMLSLWNLGRWWNNRQLLKRMEYRDKLEAAYRLRTNPKPDPSQTKPVLLPEFQFDDSPAAPPPTSPNGTSPP
ncbi:MAG: hypothetical protein K8T89_03950 [Planctomycetes bacterium]|nr:hypothetical protein [Planctomycetota bacterium]